MIEFPYDKYVNTSGEEDVLISNKKTKINKKKKKINKQKIK